ncbi:integral membrane protein S linking to the trans Golgi network-domain-containing protein [Phakopsora pachyrhizi]|nr:integral membrane protein S linking to the trans Golgi network-domain-containing protein [Phakopsora pachyrhizi]
MMTSPLRQLETIKSTTAATTTAATTATTTSSPSSSSTPPTVLRQTPREQSQQTSQLKSDTKNFRIQGGPSNVAMIMDWRELIGIGTIDQSLNLNHQHSQRTWENGNYVHGKLLPPSLGRKPSTSKKFNPRDGIFKRLNHRRISMRSDLGGGTVDDGFRGVGVVVERSYDEIIDKNLISNQTLVNLSSPKDPAADSRRSWVLSISWFMSSMIGVLFLYQIVRRPIHIMDHSLTICLNHLILTTYYSSRFPNSIWFYFVMITSSIFQIVWSENLCVRREMREGLGVGWKVDQRPDDLPIKINSNIKNNLNSNHHQYDRIYEV